MLQKIYLVRHGETRWSQSGQHSGVTEVQLTEPGEDAARKLGARLRELSLAHVLTSPRERARRTCELAGLGAAAEVDPDLAEWDYGDDEGRRSVEILSARPGWNLFRDGCPQGETPAGVAARADRMLARIRTMTGNVALFTHGHFGRVLGARWIGLPVIEAQHFLLGPACLGVLGYEHERADRPVLVRWNVAAGHALVEAGEPGLGDAPALKVRAIDRWENEGGEIPPAGSPSGAPVAKPSGAAGNTP
jgi:probable phosphoglycerate mutase